MTNEELVLRIKAGKNVNENMESLYIQVKDFIRSVAREYQESGELEDLEQEGYLALYPAIDGYDPAQGVKFLTYAEYRIRQQIRQYIQKNGSCMRLPVHCLEQIQRYNRFTSEFQREYGRKPTNRETAACLGLAPEQIETIKENGCMAHVGSLDKPVTGIDGGEDITLGEMVQDPRNGLDELEDDMQQEQLKAVLWPIVDALEGQMPDAIRARYREDLSMKETGERIGTSTEEARRLVTKALRKLRNPERSKRLRPFLPEAEIIYSQAMVGTGVETFDRTWTSSTERVALRLTEI